MSLKDLRTSHKFKKLFDECVSFAKENFIELPVLKRQSAAPMYRFRILIFNTVIRSFPYHFRF